MACDLTTVLEEACTSEIGKVTDRIMLLQLIAQLSCEIADGGIGGGGQVGSGSPEGVVTAEPGALYWDTVGKVFWVKETGSGNTGWWQIV